jgi:hypothetical protein
VTFGQDEDRTRMTRQGKKNSFPGLVNDSLDKRKLLEELFCETSELSMEQTINGDRAKTSLRVNLRGR